MAFERHWPAVPPRLLTANGGTIGQINVTSTIGFKVKAVAVLVAVGQPDLQVQIKRVVSSTLMFVGVPGTNITDHNIDLSAYTLAAGAYIYAQEQEKKEIPIDDKLYASWEQEPTVAWRTIMVDELGRFYGENNPLPIAFDGTVSIGDVHVQGENGNTIEPNPNGSLNVVIVPSVGGTTNVRNTFGEALAVLSGLTTTIVAYTVPPGKQALLQRAVGSGENIGKFTLQINSISQSVLRTYYAGPFNVEFNFTTGQDNGLVLQPGDEVKMTILHNRPFTADFDGRIQTIEIDL